MDEPPTQPIVGHILFASTGTTVMNQNSPVFTPAQIAGVFVQNAADNTPGTMPAGLATWNAVASFDRYTNHPSRVVNAVPVATGVQFE